jgi:hypothetical protein
MQPTRASSQPAVTTVSLLRNSTYSPRAIAAPALHEPMKPRLSALHAGDVGQALRRRVA